MVLTWSDPSLTLSVEDVEDIWMSGNSVSSSWGWRRIPVLPANHDLACGSYCGRTTEPDGWAEQKCTDSNPVCTGPG